MMCKCINFLRGNTNSGTAIAVADLLFCPLQIHTNYTRLNNNPESPFQESFCDIFVHILHIYYSVQVKPDKQFLASHDNEKYCNLSKVLFLIDTF